MAANARGDDEHRAGTPEGKPPSTGDVSAHWRLATVVLAILVVVVGILPFVLTESKTTVETAVVWHQYVVYGGPRVSNSTLIAAGTFCPSSTPVSPTVFSVAWAVSWPFPPSSVAELRLADAANLTLFDAREAAWGGAVWDGLTTLCTGEWTLTVNSTASVTVDTVLSLAYNYSVTTTSYVFP